MELVPPPGEIITLASILPLESTSSDDELRLLTSDSSPHSQKSPSVDSSDDKIAVTPTKEPLPLAIPVKDVPLLVASSPCPPSSEISVDSPIPPEIESFAVPPLPLSDSESESKSSEIDIPLPPLPISNPVSESPVIDQRAEADIPINETSKGEDRPKEEKRGHRRLVTFVIPPGIDPAPQRFDYFPTGSDGGDSIRTLSEEDMADPTKFSKLCRFPRGMLASLFEATQQAPDPDDGGEEEFEEEEEINFDGIESIPIMPLVGFDDDIEHLSLLDLDDLETSSSIGPRLEGNREVDLNEFLALEELSLSEESMNAHNIETIFSCLDRRMHEETFRKNIRGVLEGREESHIILLLLEPALSIEGVYVLDEECEVATKLWGDTPDRISGNEVSEFWKYIAPSDEFVKDSNHCLSNSVDAVSM
jgi:hypothetical protein